MIRMPTSWLEHVGFEPLIKKINRAHRQQLELVVTIEFRERAESLEEIAQHREFAHFQRERIGRRHRQNVFGEAAHLDHRAAVLVVDLRIGPSNAGRSHERSRVVVHAPEVIPGEHRRERAVERQDFEAMLGQLQLAEDFRPQQRHHVRADRELETRGKTLR
jgi:hypothetical protein